MENHKTDTCPYCGSKDVARILYGLPAFSKKLEKELEQKKVILGGCLVSDEAPEFHCNKCSKEWNKINKDFNK